MIRFERTLGGWVLSQCGVKERLYGISFYMFITVVENRLILINFSYEPPHPHIVTLTLINGVAKRPLTHSRSGYSHPLCGQNQR